MNEDDNINVAIKSIRKFLIVPDGGNSNNNVLYPNKIMRID